VTLLCPSSVSFSRVSWNVIPCRRYSSNPSFVRVLVVLTTEIIVSRAVSGNLQSPPSDGPPINREQPQTKLTNFLCRLRFRILIFFFYKNEKSFFLSNLFTPVLVREKISRLPGRG